MSTIITIPTIPTMEERQRQKQEVLLTRKALCLQALKKLPRGRLSMSMKNNRPYFTVFLNGHSEYLRVGDPRIQQLQDRYLVEQTLKAIDSQIQLFESGSSKHIAFDPNELVPSFPPVYRNPSTAVFKAIGFQDARVWASEPFQSCDKHQENLKITTDNGAKVRSRVEAFILSVYADAGIPVRYEELLILPSGERVYPDVHPLIPGVLREKRHEHCGLMGDPRYVEKDFLWKHQHYSQCGLIPGRDVLFTFDYTGGELDYPLLREQILNWIEFCRNE